MLIMQCHSGKTGWTVKTIWENLSLYAKEKILRYWICCVCHTFLNGEFQTVYNMHTMFEWCLMRSANKLLYKRHT